VQIAEYSASAKAGGIRLAIPGDILVFPGWDDIGEVEVVAVNQQLASKKRGLPAMARRGAR
jgi:hypothetical protein